MKATVSVTQERPIAAPAVAVWAVITTPEMHPRLDDRCHLESTSGGGGPGSAYDLTVRAGLARARLRYVVREAVAPTRWTADVIRGGKEAGTQHAELESGDFDTTVLRWTVTVPTSRLTRRAVTAACARELEKWLAAVEREALAYVG